MDLSVKDQKISFFTDKNGFLDIETVTGSQEIIQRLEKRTRLQLGTHEPRPSQGHPWSEVFDGEQDYKVLESSIYEDLLTDPDIDTTTLSVTVTKEEKIVKVVVVAYTITGEDVSFTTEKTN